MMLNLILYLMSSYTATTHKMEFDGAYCTITVKMEGRDRTFLVDTGSPYTAMNEADWKKQSDKIKLNYVTRVYGKQKYYFAERRERVELDKVPYQLNLISTNLSELDTYRRLNVGKEYFGIIGNDFMKKYIVTLDFQANTITTYRLSLSPDGVMKLKAKK